MRLRSFLKHRGLGVNLLAGACFLILAVYGWGLDWKLLGSYLLMLIIFLFGLIGIAALLVWLARKLKRTRKNKMQ
jgi:hypothetical protein